jgi:glycosyltransferase involved in cell wall biosynthesis
MRLAFATWTNSRAGGVETYLEAVTHALVGLGHDVALWHEVAGPESRGTLKLPATVTTARLDSPDQALALAQAWKPDALLVQGLEREEIEQACLSMPGSMFVAHNYAGACISGTRAWTLPVVRPCHRTLGAGCLAHYFPHGCGGRSPATMMRLYRRERRRQRTLVAANAVIALSTHMRAVLLAHGLDEHRVFHVPFGPPARKASGDQVVLKPDPATVRLVVAARLEPIKGVHLLIEALPPLRAALSRDVVLVVVGEGSARTSLEASAAHVTASDRGIDVTFAGWVGPDERDRLFSGSDVVVMPSAWPEPLGLVGIEAGRLGVPVVAFDVGGVRDWLHDGVNGRVVPGDPPTAAQLAQTLAEVLTSHTERLRLSAGAMTADMAATPVAHAQGLVDVVTMVTQRVTA